MKVEEIIEMYGEGGDDSSITVQLTNQEGKTISVGFGEGEPEDMFLFRDLSDAYNLVDFAKFAYLAGKNGEDWDFEQILEKD